MPESLVVDSQFGRRPPRWQRSAVRCATVLACMLSLVTVLPTPARADTPIRRSLSQTATVEPFIALTATTTATAGAQPVLYTCRARLWAEFSGFQDETGRIYGDWFFGGSSSCDRNMRELHVQAFMRTPVGVIFETSPRRCGVTGFPSCPDVANIVDTSAGPLSCSQCNGRWEFDSWHLFVYPGIILSIQFLDPHCLPTGNDRIECRLHAEAVL